VDEDERYLSHLLAFSPNYREVTRGKISRALRGVRPGTSDGFSHQVAGYDASGMRGGYLPNSPRGLAPLILHAEGVQIVPVRSLDEWQQRVGLFKGTGLGTAKWEGDSPAA